MVTVQNFKFENFILLKILCLILQSVTFPFRLATTKFVLVGSYEEINQSIAVNSHEVIKEFRA